ncbi:hypothetical protein Y032_0091g2428 [Ancylostoma ceylanicum]|uniref:Uncharacterized protein n=1 Tax=Ancylostoma ceylanicum TaxID=53326 RepID=A0A016TLC5_9BILA|nr:hypothetical protein Y032_0091g2428 [Ancylostoma ceylanicum]
MHRGKDVRREKKAHPVSESAVTTPSALSHFPAADEQRLYKQSLFIAEQIRTSVQRVNTLLSSERITGCRSNERTDERTNE